MGPNRRNAREEAAQVILRLGSQPAFDGDEHAFELIQCLEFA